MSHRGGMFDAALATAILMLAGGFLILMTALADYISSH